MKNVSSPGTYGCFWIKGGTMKRSIFLLTTTLLAACTVGPNYTAPTLSDIGGWSTSERAKQENSASPIAVEWWQELNDPLLNRYISEAATSNLDIKIAETRIREARAIRSVEDAGFYPEIGSNAGASVERLSENGRQLGVIPNLPGTSIDNSIEVYDAGFDAGWELDIFGGTQRAVEAADARIEEAMAARRDILLSVFAEIARNYVELRGIQRERAILQKNIDLQQQTFTIVCQRFDAGMSNEFEVTRAESQLRVTESRLPNLTAQMRSNAYQIAVLLGKEPQAIFTDIKTAKPLPIAPDIVPVGLRSDILRRRPDIRAAERRLAASTAEIGVAEAQLFPNFSLTGAVGLETLTFGDLFESGSATFALGPMIRWPVFQGGRIRARIRAEEAQAERAALEYEQAVLRALRDVETALVRYGQELETVERLEKAVAVNERAVRLAEQRYGDGEDDILAVVDAERELTDIERELVVAQTRSITHLISLYKALGGGWEPFDVNSNQRRPS